MLFHFFAFSPSKNFIVANACHDCINIPIHIHSISLKANVTQHHITNVTPTLTNTTFKQNPFWNQKEWTPTPISWKWVHLGSILQLTCSFDSITCLLATSSYLSTTPMTFLPIFPPPLFLLPCSPCIIYYVIQFEIVYYYVYYIGNNEGSSSLN